MNGRDNLTVRVSAAYNLPVAAFGALFMLIIMYYMKFATDVLFMSPVVVGLIFGVVRLWDAVADACVGYLSDRTRSKYGRRRPWLLLSAIPIGVSFIMAFSPPPHLSGIALSAWVFVAILGFYTATTAFVVPHMALGAEMTGEGAARSKLFGMRWSALVIGYMVGIGAMSLLIDAEAGGTQSARASASLISIVGALGMASALVYASLTLRERLDFQERSARGPFEAFGDVLRNRHAQKLLFVAFVEFAGASVTGVMALYVTQYVLKAPAFGPLLFLVWLVFSLIAVPVWVWLSRFLAKRDLWTAALIVSALSYGSLIFLGEGDVWFMMGVMVLTGAAAACGNTMGPATQCDVIDDDERRTGQRKEGTYFACWNLVVKAASGFTVLIAGVILEFSGFVPGAEQSADTKFAMLAFLALFPLAAYLAGALVLRSLSLKPAQPQTAG
jgi:GPH family glycoside/pentoside/hexuronide:cation symporter